MGSKSPCRRAILSGGGKGVPSNEEGLSAMSCAKIAEPIEMQFGMLSVVGRGNHVLDGGADALMVRGTVGVSGCLKRIVKHRFRG